MLMYEVYVEYYNVIFVSVICFFGSMMAVLLYHGVFNAIEVKTTKSPFMKDTFVVYKFTQNYAQSRTLLTEVQTLAPHLKSFSIYHESFNMRSQVGSSIGVVLSEEADEKLYHQLVHAGYKAAVFPAVEYAVVSSFPYRNQYSLAVAVSRIYPRFRGYIKANRLCAHPIIELYTKDKVHFIAPLSKQFDFYADEAIPDYEDSSSNEEEEASLDKPSSSLDKPECAKCQNHKARAKCCYCDPLVNVNSCDRRKKAM